MPGLSVLLMLCYYLSFTTTFGMASEEYQQTPKPMGWIAIEDCPFASFYKGQDVVRNEEHMQEEKRPDRPHPCPECGGQRVAVQCSPQMNLVQSKFSFRGLSLLQAVSCTNCGHTTLYAKTPENLRKLLPEQG